MGRLLITSLGTADYRSCRYRWEGGAYETTMSGDALTRALTPTRVVVLCTAAAWEKNGAAFRKYVSEAHYETLPDGETEEDQRELFSKYLEVITSAPEAEIILDITFGFRAQPYVAAAAVNMTLFTAENPPDLRILYAGALPREGVNPEVPIWELTDGVFESLRWARGLDLLLNTGNIPERLTTQLREKGVAHRKEQRQLAEPLQEFAVSLSAYVNDLGCINVPDLVGPTGSAARVLTNSKRLTTALVALPALRNVLARLQKQLEPLAASPLGPKPAGDEVLLALAEHYFKLGRIPECITVIREGVISLADEANAVARMPGKSVSTAEGREARYKLEQAVGAADPEFKDIAQFRNPVDHAGFQFGDERKPSDTLRNGVARWLGIYRARVKAAG